MLNKPEDWQMLNSELAAYGEDSSIVREILNFGVVVRNRHPHDINAVKHIGWMPDNDPMLLRQQAHLARIYEYIPDFFKCESFLEVGAGFGSMARFVLGNTNSAVLYEIYDLPEMVKLQRRKMRDLFSIVRWQEPSENPFYPPEHNGSFIAIMSLSEMNRKERIVAEKAPDFKYWVIAYQDSFGDVDNNRWFADFRADRTNIEWHTKRFRQITYMVGIRK